MKNKLLKTLFLSSIICTASSIQAQNVGIGTNNPSPSAKLDITDTQKGVLIPRISIPNLNAAAPVTSPATSLIVYNNNVATGIGFYYWNGSQWAALNDHDWYKVGTTTAPNNINDNIFTQGNVGVGTITPTTNLDVAGVSRSSRGTISGNQGHVAFSTAGAIGSGTNNYLRITLPLNALASTGDRGYTIKMQHKNYYQASFAANLLSEDVVLFNVNVVGLGTPTGYLVEVEADKLQSNYEYDYTFDVPGNQLHLNIRPTQVNGAGRTSAIDLYITARNNSAFNQQIIQGWVNGATATLLSQPSLSTQTVALSTPVEWTDAPNHIYATQANTAGNDVVILDNGRVGIGTNNPQAKLEVKAGAENQTGPVEAIRIWGPNSPTNSNSAQDLNFQFAAAGSAGVRAYRGGSWDTYLQFYTNNVLSVGNVPSVRMTLDHNGFLGVGTTSPLALTHISSTTTGDAVLRVEADTDDNNEDDNPRLELYQDGGQTGTMMGFFDGGFLGGNIFRIGTRFSGVNDWATLTINTDNKNVGIGTASPSDRLQVAGDARIGLINPANTTTFPQDGNRLYFSGTTAGIANSDNTDPIYINRHNSAGDQSQLRVNVGDNTQAQDALVVGYTSGGFQERIRLQTDGNALKPGGGTWATLSDRRTKKEITPFEDGLNVLTKINPVTFKYNGLYNTVDDDQNHVGIIAQEVQPIAPYMIGTQTTEQQELLNYDGGTYMIYILVNAVKQQQQQLETTTKQNQTLQAEINTLKQTNATMASKLSELETLKAEVQAIKELLNSNAQK